MLGMTILFCNRRFFRKSLSLQQNCHPDRSVAQWRDLRLRLVRRIVQIGQPDLPLFDTGQAFLIVVFTAQYHLKRGACCNSGCGHCPYRSSTSTESPGSGHT
jgi:hypothetical protein